MRCLKYIKNSECTMGVENFCLEAMSWKCAGESVQLELRKMSTSTINTQSWNYKKREGSIDEWRNNIILQGFWRVSEHF